MEVRNIDRSSNGKTAASKTANVGSIPTRSAMQMLVRITSFLGKRPACSIQAVKGGPGTVVFTILLQSLGISITGSATDFESVR